jgi:cobalt-zinc-cadmium resistance protein CzcA
MLNKLAEFALTQRLLTLLFTLMLIAAGVQAWIQIPIDAFPDVSTTQVKLILKAPGMTPEEVEARIVAPIETEMLGIPKQRLLRSVAKYALTDITIDFEDGTDIYWARQQVAERLAAAMGDLPAGVSGGMAPITTPLSEMFMFTVDGPLPLDERRAVLDWVIRPQLRTLAGVADVNALGGFVRSFEVAPDNAAMSSRGVTLAELMTSLESNLKNDGAGRLAEGDEVWVVRIEGAVKSLDDLAAIVVKKVGGVPVRVADVAQVRLSSLTRYGGVTQDGKGEAVEGLVLGLKGANAQQVVALVKKRLKEIAPLLPKGVSVNAFYDRSSLVERAVGTVTRALMEATVLVLALLFLFLGNVRAALTVAVVLPLSALAAFWLMRRFGLSANLMSLGGLAIAIGLLVDAAVVVVENIVTRLALHPSPAVEGARPPKLHEVYRAVREVSGPTTAGVLIILIVFLPLLSLEGLEGKLFIPVALTIVFALGAALLLSLTVVPALGALLIKEGAHGEPWLMRQLDRAYRPLLDWALGHFRLVMIGAVALLLAAAAIYPFIGKSFMPTLDEGDLLVQLEKLPSISLEASLAIDIRVQQALLARVPEVKGVVARAGSDELGLDPMGLNQTDSFLVLKPKETWRKPDKEWLMEEIRKVMADFPGVTFGFTQPIDMRVSEMLTGSRGDLAVKVFGTDLTTLNLLAGEIETLLKAIPGAQDVFSVKNDGVQYFRVEIDRLALGRYGLTVDEVSDFLKAHLEGVKLGVVQEGARRTPLVVRAGENVRASPALFERLRIPTGDGLAIPLNEVAHLIRADGGGEPGKWRALCGHSKQCRRTRSGQLCRGRQAWRRRQGQAAAGLPRGLRRPVREPAARGDASGSGGAGGVGADFSAAVRHLPQSAPGRADHGQRAVRPGRRRHGAGRHRRISVGAGFGRLYRLARHCGVERRRAGVLLQPVARRRTRRHQRGARRLVAQAASGDDDRQHHRLRPAAAAHRQRAGFGNPETAGHRGDGRPVHFHRADPVGAAGAVSTFHIARKSMSLVQLTLVAPASLEETLAEYLLAHPEWGGAFTLLHAEGRGSREHTLTPQEQVRGRVTRTQFQVVLEADAAGRLLAELKRAFPKRDVAWWITPVMDFGRLA